jgi:hypothetical protein
MRENNESMAYIPNVKDVKEEIEFVKGHLNHRSVFGDLKTPNQIEVLLSPFYHTDEPRTD